ncbi:MAG: UDP-N-acetylmuramate dehydrogenase [Spirochaetes bacterium]|nr:MAG: UDP-N-acetylmuramate dehydrogenase [Spirochaetota bacterium]
MRNPITSELIEKLAAQGCALANEPMSRHTTFKVGGPAELLVCPSGPRQAAAVVSLVNEARIPLTVIGGGSNLLVGDRGIPGITLSLGHDGAWKGEMRRCADGTVYADATVPKERFIDWCLDEGLEGADFMAGIPGCLGGGIVMNAGTFMGNFIDILTRIEYIDRKGASKSLEVRREMAHYRRMDMEEGAVITGAVFRLPESADIRSARARIRAILDDRGAKHPLQYPSAGSVFKNPDGHSSWKLIDEAGLKGYRIGGAMVSELHTNFIVNVDGASAGDVRALIEHVRDTVSRRFSIALHPEVRMTGEF